MTRSTQQDPEFITEAMAKTLPDLFDARAEKTPDKIAYQQYIASRDSWRSYTWNEMHQLVCRWRLAMERESLDQGDRVAVMAGNSIEWICFEQAAQSLGLVTVSLYTTDTAESIRYILTDAGARLLLVENLSAWQKLFEQVPPIPSLQRVWCLEKKETHGKKQDQLLNFMDDILPDVVSSHDTASIDPESLATIIYTSGTTGRPKGVMLSHHNILSNAEAVQEIVPARPSDIFLSFLPLAHGFERTAEYILPMMAGSCVTYARSISGLRDDLVSVRPTVFISAPRLYEKFYVAIQNNIATSGLKRNLFDWTVSLGWQQFLADQNRGPQLNPIQKLFLKLLRQLVSKKVLTRLGGRLRIAVTGAAPLSAKVSRFFIGLGLPLLEGYGLTEAGPVVCANYLDCNVPGSVGMPVPGVEVKVSEGDELLVRSPGVMKGYWQREQDTRQVIDEEGWLHTGDLSKIEENFVYIIGRSKEILVTSTAEKVAPADMETAITLDKLFEQAMVVGERKPFISALLVLNKNAWPDFASGLGVEPEEDPAHNEKTLNAVLERLAGLLCAFPVYAQVHAVSLSFEPWTVENGLLTPTLKIKRHVLEEKFAEEIKGLYRGHEMLE